MKFTRVFVAGAIALLAACSDSNGPSGMSGTVSFSYSGGTSGSFSTTGAVPLGGQTETVEWAAGFRSDADQAIGVVATLPRSSSTHDWFYLQAPLLAAGTVTINPNCSADNCAAVLVDLGVNNTTQESDFFCGLTAGTITVTALSSTRMRGTFNGTGECITATTTTGFTVTNGSFDVALISGVAGL